MNVIRKRLHKLDLLYITAMKHTNSKVDIIDVAECRCFVCHGVVCLLNDRARCEACDPRAVTSVLGSMGYVVNCQAVACARAVRR